MLKARLEEFLRREHVPYTSFTHAPAYTAQEEAAVAHVPGRSWAKVVICFADDEPIMAVLPAHFSVDFGQLAALAGARQVRLATEPEMAALYPECEVGTMPPFGPLYHHRIFVDRSLEGAPDLAFNAGTHTDAIRMRYDDLAALSHPTAGAFGRAPGH